MVPCAGMERAPQTGGKLQAGEGERRSPGQDADSLRDDSPRGVALTRLAQLSRSGPSVTAQRLALNRMFGPAVVFQRKPGDDGALRTAAVAERVLYDPGRLTIDAGKAILARLAADDATALNGLQGATAAAAEIQPLNSSEWGLGTVEGEAFIVLGQDRFVQWQHLIDTYEMVLVAHSHPLFQDPQAPEDVAKSRELEAESALTLANIGALSEGRLAMRVLPTVSDVKAAQKQVARGQADHTVYTPYAVADRNGVPHVANPAAAPNAPRLNFVISQIVEQGIQLECRIDARSGGNALFTATGWGFKMLNSSPISLK